MAILLDSVELPDLDWTDERWTKFTQAKARSLTGKVIVDRSQRIAGRPVTLKGGSKWGAITRAQLQALEALANTPGDMNLTLPDGRVLVVQFEYPDPIQAEEWTGNVSEPDSPHADDLFINVILKFFTTQE